MGGRIYDVITGLEPVIQEKIASFPAGWPKPVLGLNPGIEPIAVRFYFTDTGPNLDVTPESALALIRGPGPILRFRLGSDPG